MRTKFTIWKMAFSAWWFISLILITAVVQPQSLSIQDLRVESIKLDQVDMGEALKQLRSESKRQVLIGFEEIPQASGQQQLKPISIELHNETVDTILNRFVAADSRYIYEITDDSVINVFPLGAKNDPANFLNIRVSKFAVHERALPQSIFRRIGVYAPELREYLKKKAQEHAAQTGDRPAGIAGSIISGGMEPRIDIEMQNVTVREILNAFALYTVKLSRDPNWFSLGWKYEFIINPEAETGLGGYPKWSEF